MQDKKYKISYFQKLFLNKKKKIVDLKKMDESNEVYCQIRTSFTDRKSEKNISNFYVYIKMFN